jgi:hypothetical protein
MSLAGRTPATAASDAPAPGLLVRCQRLLQRPVPGWLVAVALATAVTIAYLPIGLRGIEAEGRWDRDLALIGAGSWKNVEFTHPPLYFNVVGALLRLFVIVMGWGAGSADYLAAHMLHGRTLGVAGTLIGIVIGGLGGALAYRVATRLGGRAAGWAAVAVAARTVPLAFWSGITAVDVMAGVMSLLAVDFTLSVAEGGGRRSIWLAGAACGLAVATNWNTAPVGFSLIAAHLWAVRGGSPIPISARWLPTLLSGALGLFIGIPQLFVHPGRVLTDLFGLLVPVAYVTEFRDSNTSPWFYLEILANPIKGLGLPCALLCAVALVDAFVRRQARAMAFALFPVGYLLAMSALQTRDAHWIIVALPACTVLSGLGALRIGEWVGRMAGATGRFAALLPALVAVSLVLSSARPFVSDSSVHLKPIDVWRSDDDRLREWLQAHVGDGPVVVDQFVRTPPLLLTTGDPHDPWAAGRKVAVERSGLRELTLAATLSAYIPNLPYDHLDDLRPDQPLWIVLTPREQQMYLRLSDRNPEQFAGYRRFRSWLRTHARRMTTVEGPRGEALFEVYLRHAATPGAVR